MKAKKTHSESYRRDCLSPRFCDYLIVVSKLPSGRTDASDEGIGAVLLQEFSGTNFPVAYASKKLNSCQKKYSTIEKECLAIIWAVQKFQTYLYGTKFIIETDHQPLACIRKSNVANGRIMRWALALQPYRFRIQIIKGSENVLGLTI